MADATDPKGIAGQLSKPADDELGHALLRDRARAMLFDSPSSLRIGRFEVERRVGQGGMGEVFLARDAQLRRPVAIKLVHERLMADHDSASRERAVREAQALARVSHPNVIEVFDVGEHEGRPYVAMEYVEGQTLGEWLDERPRSWREVVGVFIEAGRGLFAVHRCGLVHRDFKSDNVLISEEGDERRVRVLDFGLARLKVDGEALVESFDEGGDQALTLAGTVLGTLRYMSLEQLLGDPVGLASDQFSFCVALYWALWDGDPFAGGNVNERIAYMRRHDATTPVAHEGPRRLWAIVRRGLAHEGDERWPDMGALLGALEQVARSRRRGPWVAIAVAALGVGLGVGLGVPQAEPVEVDADPCQHVTDRIEQLWTPERSNATRVAFEATQLSYADHAFATIDTKLEPWSTGWSERRAAICRAGEDASLRAGCLDRAQVEVQTLIDTFVDADVDTVRQVADSLHDLPSLAGCDNDEALALGLEPVPDALADELAVHREALARARALRRAGQPGEALAALETLEAESSSCDYPPFVAELSVERGRLELAKGSTSRLEQGAKLADRARHDRLAAHVWTELAFWAVNVSSGPLPETTAWLERAETGSLRLGSPVGLEARLHCIRGTLIGREQGREQEARAALERGLALLDALGDRDETWLGMGESMSHAWEPLCLGELADLASGQVALELRERALAHAEAIYGVDHPATARYAFDLAGLLLNSDASADRERSVALLEHVGGVWIAGHEVSAISLARGHVSLASVALQGGRLAEARRHSGAARSVYARALPPSDSQHAQPLLIDGMIAYKAGDPEAALTHFERARPYLADDPELEPALADLDHNRAFCLLDLGRLEAAQVLFEAHAQRQLDAGQDVTTTTLRLARIALRRGQLDQARSVASKIASPLQPKLALQRRLIMFLAAKRAGQPEDCAALTAELRDLASDLEPDEAATIQKLLTDVHATPSERRCAGYP